MRLLSHPRFTLDLCAAEKPAFEGSGTEDDPFQIKTVADLKKLDELVTGGETFADVFFKQMADIDMSEVSDWNGIGTMYTAGTDYFAGKYDGANFGISNVAMKSEVNYSGCLFNDVRNAEIKNVTIHIASTTGKGGVAGLVGTAHNGLLISNCVVKGEITGSHHCGGFLAFGPNGYGGGTACAPVIIDSINEATVISTKSAAGFMAKPQNYVIFTNCVNKGTIVYIKDDNDGDGAGGFISSVTKGDFVGCSNEGAVYYAEAASIAAYKENPNNVSNVYGQFGPGARMITATTTCSDDSIAFAGTVDGGNFADKAAIVDNMATLISNDQVVVGGEYLVMSKITTLPITLDTVGQTIAFDNALNTAFAATITADGVAVTTNEAGTVTTYTAIEIPAPTPTWPEDWPADADDNVKKAFDTWAKAYGVTSFKGKEDAFLMNVDPEGTVPELKIESISVEGTTATIVVSSTKSLEDINGVLYVDATDDLADWTTTEVELPAEFDKDGKATFTVNAANFMKAGVGFKAPAVDAK